MRKNILLILFIIINIITLSENYNINDENKSNYMIFYSKIENDIKNKEKSEKNQNEKIEKNDKTIKITTNKQVPSMEYRTFYSKIKATIEKEKKPLDNGKNEETKKVSKKEKNEKEKIETVKTEKIKIEEIKTEETKIERVKIEKVKTEKEEKTELVKKIVEGVLIRKTEGEKPESFNERYENVMVKAEKNRIEKVNRKTIETKIETKAKTEKKASYAYTPKGKNDKLIDGIIRDILPKKAPDKKLPKKFMKDTQKFAYNIVNVRDLKNIKGKEKKEAFIQTLVPIIDEIHSDIRKNKTRVEKIVKNGIKNDKEEKFMEEMFSRYNVTTKKSEELLDKMIIVPTSLVLAQASLESGWGTSQVAVGANNLFGMKSFAKDQSSYKVDKNTHYKRYASIKASVNDYMLTLARHRAYIKLRKGIEKGEDSLELVKHLNNYSELRAEYGKKVRIIIKVNNLSEYDA
ncbi:MAG: glucosaminidase domain-containing protein [Fusobacteriaceae bacterium]|jgi:Bax protein|nr:glucosaminidase domain-containing protein [Fusobacteriaceae bacterium]